MGPIRRLYRPDCPAGLFGSAKGWSLGTPTFMILEMDPSSFVTVDEMALIPFSVVNKGSSALRPVKLEPNKPNLFGLLAFWLSFEFSLFEDVLFAF